jgi:polysaccharide pyruvyl transferase WcaK-like protein
MQCAMIANLRKRIAGVEIVGITLTTEETRRRHGIPAFPLAAVSRTSYTVYNSGISKTGQRNTPVLRRTKQWLKQMPMLGRFLRAIRVWATEMNHLAAAAALVRKLDRIVIPGGGALDDFWGGPWGHPWSLFKWSLLSRVCGVPFLFVSIGKSSLEQPLSRFFVRVALRLAAYRSYRDNESRVAVRTLIDARSDPVYPDLAFSYPCPIPQTSPGSGSPDGRLVIGVSPIAYCDPRAWPCKDERRYAAYVSQTAEIVKWLIREGYRVLFFTTDSPDIATVEDVQAMISGCAMDADAIETLPGSSDQTTESLLKELRRAELVIASRLHGVILSHLSAIPVLGISFDPKVDAHMNAIGQRDYCLNIDHLRLDAVIERFNALKALREEEANRIRCSALAFRQQLETQYDRIFAAPHSNPAQGECQNQIETSALSEYGGSRTP